MLEEEYVQAMKTEEVGLLSLASTAKPLTSLPDSMLVMFPIPSAKPLLFDQIKLEM